jgi:ADP-ribose pyrophosphatase YjhB (NUDIX family)
VQIWSNPIPVGVVLLPVRRDGQTGLLVIRRGIEPRRGMLALAGGFLEDHETWQAGSARELREETGIHVDPALVQPFWWTSTEPRPNRVLLFGEAPPLDASRLPAFTPTDETTARGLVFGPDGLGPLSAFPLHLEAMVRWFRQRNLSGPHGFLEV